MRVCHSAIAALLLTTEFGIRFFPLSFYRALKLFERRLIRSIVNEVLRSEYDSQLGLVVSSLIWYAATITHDVDDRSFRTFRAEEMSRFTNTFPAVAMSAMAGPELLEEFVHPVIDVLVLVSKQSFTVSTMVFELRHKTWCGWWDLNPQNLFRLREAPLPI